ncbi:unnamed protein product [Spirodela intermedia]|uniref:Uncharacterized protein n=1 Tax=Spirodela intermedia TaxID=51605 RepID=A0A7I8J6R6_SPIIN|nr:unnamed protein product [Spirodela intermedia]CAA6665710.1 unnamed protein product [Spirodela intermedia]
MGDGVLTKVIFFSWFFIQVLLSRNSSLETQIRRETEAAIRHLRSEAGACSCSRNAANECRECLLRGVTERLRDAGYNSAVCNSKWTTSSSIPKAGEHTYIDVVEAADGTKGPVRVVIEVCFRAEFEMARASEEYRRLVYRLPEVFVGKPEKLRGVIKTVCAAAKKCMEDNKMHMAPWRKSKYMQAKWLTPCEREPPRAALSPTEAAFSANRHRKPQASMLTFDLLDKLPGLHWPAVRVL